MPRPSLACLLPFALLTVLCARPAGAWEQDRPERFDYYILVLGWSPSYSEGEGAQRHCRQCDTDKPGGFVLHGLWPQYMRGWPQDFRIQQRPWVPRSVIDDMADIMPSKSMIIHEYRAHGTCAGLEPKQYFSLARDLYDRITIPPRFTGLDSPLMLSPDEIEGDFLKANPWLSASMISVICRRQELLDVRVCFGRDLFPKSCGPNEDRGLCRLPKVEIPPAPGR